MSLISICLYAFYLCIAAFVIYTGYALSRRYPYKFLKYYVYYLVFYYIYGFIYYIGISFNLLLFPALESFQLAAQLVLLLAIPAHILYFYFLILWIFELLGRRLPAWFWWAYFSLQALLVLRVAVRLKTLLDTHDLQLSGPTTLLQTAGAVISYVAFVYLILGGRRDLSDKRKALARWLGALSLFGLTLFIIFVEVLDLPFYSNYTFMLLSVALLHSVVNLPPVLVLKRFLNRYPQELGGAMPATSKLHGFYDEHHLTPREREIITLIMAGKDTKEIAKALFISSKTVKNNISNIFQKTHVRSRIQLLSIIESYRSAPEA